MHCTHAERLFARSVLMLWRIPLLFSERGGKGHSRSRPFLSAPRLRNRQTPWGRTVSAAGRDAAWKAMPRRLWEEEEEGGSRGYSKVTKGGREPGGSCFLDHICTRGRLHHTILQRVFYGPSSFKVLQVKNTSTLAMILLEQLKKWRLCLCLLILLLTPLRLC